MVEGFLHTWACSLWGVSDDRVHRWRARRRDVGTLVDRAPGGNPVHALLPTEVEAILAVAEQWGTIDGSHRKLAHRGSYTNTVWVSPSTFRRVLAAHGLVVPEPPARTPSVRKPWPDWLVWEPNRIWIWDVERHEALPDRAVVKGHRHRPVAAGRLKLRAARSLGRGGGRTAALTTTERTSTARWSGSGKRDGEAYVRNQRLNAPQEIHQLEPGGYGLESSAHPPRRATPGLDYVAGREATVKVCGVAVAMLQGHSWSPIPSNGQGVNVGTTSAVPSPASRQLVGGKARRRLMPPGWGGGPVVVRGRESRPHGEGAQRVRSINADCGGRR